MENKDAMHCAPSKSALPTTTKILYFPLTIQHHSQESTRLMFHTSYLQLRNSLLLIGPYPKFSVLGDELSPEANRAARLWLKAFAA
jgi:hypothetical protein